jgi:hypothetical protein
LGVIEDSHGFKVTGPDDEGVHASWQFSGDKQVPAISRERLAVVDEMWVRDLSDHCSEPIG